MPSIWTATELVQLELQLAGRQSLLEFGCGEATLVAARQARQIVAVDGDRERLAAIARRLGEEAEGYTPYQPEIGPVDAEGRPTDPARLRDWPRYHTHIWRHLTGSPDAVLIDGRFRVACLLQAIVHCKPDAMLLFHDFRDRAAYHLVLNHCDVLARVDTLAVLRVRPQVDGKAVLHDLFDHFFDPD